MNPKLIACLGCLGVSTLAATAAHAAATGGFIALLDEKNSATDSPSSVVFYDVDDMTHPLFAAFIGFEADGEEPTSMTVDPNTGDVYVVARDSGTADGSTFDTEVGGGQDGIGDLDIYKIDFQAAYDHWAANYQGAGAGGSDVYVTYGRDANSDLAHTNYQTAGPYVSTKIGEVARSAGQSGVYYDGRLEFVDENTLIYLDASTDDTGAPGTDVRVKAFTRVSTSPGAATWTPGSEEGGFNFSSSTESWESVLLGELNLDFGGSASDIGAGNADTAMVINQNGVTGFWVVEDDGSGDDLAFFEITNFTGTAGNGLREFNIEFDPINNPGEYLDTLAADQNPSVDPSSNDGDVRRIFVDANGNLVMTESGFYDDPQTEPAVQVLNIVSMDDGNGRIELGDWDANILMDLTGLTDDDGLVTDDRMSILDTYNNVLYVYDSDTPTDGGSYNQDWYMIDLDTGVTSFIVQDVDNIISYSFGDDTAEYFCLGCAVALDGDLNGDGFVGLDDLDIVLGNWNQNVTAGDWLQGDPSGDGFVGLDDLDFILGNWNAGTPPTASVVPEPASLALFTIAGLSALARRRSNA